MNFIKKGWKYATGFFAVALSGSALALPPDVTSIVAAVDYSTIIAGIIAVAAIVATVAVTIKGSVMMLAFLRRS